MSILVTGGCDYIGSVTVDVLHASGQGGVLLQALLDEGVGRLVFSSSCSVYGDPEHAPFNESDLSRPISPYGWSKLLLE